MSARTQMWKPRQTAAGLVLVAGFALAVPGRAVAGDTDVTACDAAGAAAEREHALPSGLLRAIGRAESGRRVAGSAQLVAWPWTINAEGAGQAFTSRADAVATTQRLQQSGIASIDVGCFQVNLVHHRTAFASLEDGFDPARNADYAARFLQGLRLRTGSWDGAVAAYHSSTPELGGPYRDRVMASWARDGGAGPTDGAGDPTGRGVVASAAAAPVVAAPVIRMVTWSPAKPVGMPRPSGGPGGGVGVGSSMHIWTPSAAGMGASVIRITRG